MSQHDELATRIIMDLLAKTEKNSEQIQGLEVKVSKIESIEEAIKKLEESKLNRPVFLVEIGSKTKGIVIGAASVGVAGWLFAFWHTLWDALTKFFK